MLSVADPQGRRAHDAYHRFVRAGRWSMTALWRVLAVHAVAVFAPAGTVILDCDDTVYKKTGRQVTGTGIFRDAVRSTRARVVYAWGLNLVIITLRVTPPWGGCPLGLPINMRVHHKGGATTVELAAQMIARSPTGSRAGAAPARRRRLRQPGRRRPAAHRGDLPAASRRRPLRTRPAPHRQTRTAPHQGRPVAHPTRTRRRGHRLGRRRHRPARHHRDPPVWHRDVLWYRACPRRLVRLVVVRDPTGAHPDDFFVTSAPPPTPPQSPPATPGAGRSR